jgi:membrane protein
MARRADPRRHAASTHNAGDRADVGVADVADLGAELVDRVAGLEARSNRFLGRHPRSAKAAGLVDAVVRRQGAQQLGLVASGAAFWLVVSALPTAIAVVSLYGLVVDPARVAGDLGKLVNGAPASLGSLIAEQLQRVAATDRTGLTIGLVVSVALAIWSASAGAYHLDSAIRDAYGLPRQRYVDARARSFAEAAVVVVVLGAVALGGAAVLARSRGALAVAVGPPSIFIGIVAAVTCLYRFAVGQRMRLRALLPGAVAAAVGIVVVLVGFGAYASASTRFTAVYGAFGAAVVGMLATYLAVYATLLGAVLNTELARTDSDPSMTSDTAP